MEVIVREIGRGRVYTIQRRIVKKKHSQYEYKQVTIYLPIRIWKRYDKVKVMRAVLEIDNRRVPCMIIVPPDIELVDGEDNCKLVEVSELAYAIG